MTKNNYLFFPGPMKVQFPGLNAPIEAALEQSEAVPMAIAPQTEDEIQEGQLTVRKLLEAKG